MKTPHTHTQKKKKKQKKKKGRKLDLPGLTASRILPWSSSHINHWYIRPNKATPPCPSPVAYER